MLRTLQSPQRHFLRAIVVKKQKVQTHIQADGNKLYNFMIKLCLIDTMAAHGDVTMIPDPRSIKVKSGNSLHDYLQTCLWFDKNVGTRLATIPSDSKNCKGIQFADMLAGLIQAHYEDSDSACIKMLSSKVVVKTLFF